MKLYSIETGFFKLDGGAMFGVVPKSIWQKLNPADENNMCTWAMRCLLVEEGKRLMLIDNGLGDKQSDKFFSYYYPTYPTTLKQSLNNHGFTMDDITDVLLTHLHFDHCGGSIQRKLNSESYEPAFKNATYWVNEDHWNWAIAPNAREKASFLKENILPISESGQLKKIKGNEPILPNLKLRLVHGHTEAMMLPELNYNGKTLVYMADLIPSSHHIGMPYIMGYDLRPLVTLQEKENFLPEAASNNFILMFEHDPLIECATVKQTDRGIKVDKSFSLDSV